MRSRAGASALALLCCAAFASGCEGCGDPPLPRTVSPPSSSASAAPRALPPARVVHDLYGALPTCDFEHRGLLIDTGSEGMTGRLGWRVGIPPGITTVEHSGSTWAKSFEKRLDFTFTLEEPTPIFVAARVIGRASRAAAVSLDDQPIGTLNLAKEQIRVATTPTTTLPVDAGFHTITLRFTGRSRSDEDPLAEIDWVRVGVPDDDPSTYGPPTLRDVAAPAAALGGVPHRAITLRAPGAVRCPVRVPVGASLRAAVGMVGAGEGDAEVRVLRDGQEPVVMTTVRVTGGERAVWTDIDVPLTRFAGSLVTIELHAVHGARGGRILFGDPAIGVVAPPPPPVPTARAVVIVALDGVERSELPPWAPGPTPGLPTLSDLALTGTTFDRHRAPTGVVPGVIASLLTGEPPRAHSLTDLGARLPASRTTIHQVARDASVRTAMFTGVPTTFAAFGFKGSWERFVEHPPTSGAPATAPLDDAAAWIAGTLRGSSTERFLVMVHARGGHPPWHVTPKELAAIPPVDYAGMIDPRRAGQVLANVRQKASLTLSPADRDRVRALAALALSGQDRALGAIIAALRAGGLWDTTLFIVTGDVASGATEGLYGDSPDLQEPALTLPLYVHFPGSLFGGARVEAPTEIYDIARTTLASLGLTFPKESFGRDLAAVASGFGYSATEPQIATFGDRYSVRWDELVLSGRADAPPQLCDLGLDPTCAFNRRAIMPLATQALFRRFVQRDVAVRAPPDRREPVTVDADTAALLSVWGVD